MPVTERGKLMIEAIGLTKRYGRTVAVDDLSFTVQPGRVTMTSVRPPCQVAVPSRKNELEPAFPLPRVYPLKSCPPGHRFSALVIVQR